MPFQPGAVAADELADRQRVQELIAQQQQRARRQGGDVVMPGGHLARQRARLGGAEAGRGLDQMHAQGGAEGGRGLADGAQRIGHQRAPARAAFGQDHGVGTSHRLPCHGAPGAEHLAKGLGDLGRGGEIARAAELRCLPRVIGGDRPCHEAIEAFRHQAAAGRDRARRISHSPTATIGTDSTCPMVIPAKRKPRWASGWRNNSPISRATP